MLSGGAQRSFASPTPSTYSLDFSPDGRWLATADPEGGSSGRGTGGHRRSLEGSDVAMEIRLSRTGDLVAANMNTERRRLGLWSVPEGRLLRTLKLGDAGLTSFFRFSPDGGRLITSTDPLPGEPNERVVRSWPVEGGKPDFIARLPTHPSSTYVPPDMDATGSRLAWADGRTLRVAFLEGTSADLASAASVEHERTVAVKFSTHRDSRGHV